MNSVDVVTESFMAEEAKKPFVSTLEERLVSILLLPLCYIYVNLAFQSSTTWSIFFSIFVVGFVVLTEILYKDRGRTFESYFFLIALLIMAFRMVFDYGEVWSTFEVGLFLHLFAVYWVMVRSDRLSESTTSRFFLWDGIYAFFVLPFYNFILIFKTIKSISKGEKKEIDANKLCAGIFASFLGVILLILAIAFLNNSDENYAQLMGDISGVFYLDYLTIGKLILSIFVAMYLYGLMGGCKRIPRTVVEENASLIKSFITAIAKVPSIVWIVFIGIFSFFYILYFALQGSYLLDAFRMRLPEEFTFSEYARHGFMEMCAVMIINFIVLWLANRITDFQNKGIKVVSTLLVIESMIFAVIAFLKLFMYINAYGFSPLRVESLWLIVVLTLACICVLISIHTGKRTARVWFLSSAGMLAILCLF